MTVATYLQSNSWNLKYNENLLNGLDAQGITYHLDYAINGSFFVMVSPDFKDAAMRVVLNTPHLWFITGAPSGALLPMKDNTAE